MVPLIAECEMRTCGFRELYYALSLTPGCDKNNSDKASISSENISIKCRPQGGNSRFLLVKVES